MIPVLKDGATPYSGGVDAIDVSVPLGTRVILRGSAYSVEERKGSEGPRRDTDAHISYCAPSAVTFTVFGL